jgi:hypothetical protein
MFCYFVCWGFIILIKGRIRILGLCNLNCVFSIGSEGFFWTRHFILCLSMIKLHWRSVFCMSFWYLSVGSLGSKRKFLAARNVCPFLEYASEFTVTIFLPLSAWTSIVFSVTSFWLNSFVIYNRHFRRMLFHFLKYFSYPKEIFKYNLKLYVQYNVLYF